jgi:hypothetical protein
MLAVLHCHQPRQARDMCDQKGWSKVPSGARRFKALRKRTASFKARLKFSGSVTAAENSGRRQPRQQKRTNGQLHPARYAFILAFWSKAIGFNHALVEIAVSSYEGLSVTVSGFNGPKRTSRRDIGRADFWPSTLPALRI